MLTRIFVPMKEEVTGGCQNLHNEELHNLCSSPNIMDGTCSVCGGDEKCMQGFRY
jgi:hypothetical protein